MENQNNNSRIIPKGSFIFCIAVGIIAFAITAFCFVTMNAGQKNKVKTQATVVSITGDSVYVDYSYGGLDFRNVELVMFSKPSVGEQITVYLDKEDYSSAVNYSMSRQIAVIFLVVGSVFSLAGIAGLILRRRIMGKVDTIIQAGKYIYVDVDKVVYETSITSEDGRHPFILYCHYEDFKGMHRHDYVLDNIYTNPNAYLAANKNRLKLYIKGKNYRKYRFDPSILEIK